MCVGLVATAVSCNVELIRFALRDGDANVFSLFTVLPTVYLL